MTKQSEDRIYKLESRMSVLDGKVDGVDGKLDIVLSKINGFFESGINLKNLEKEYEKTCLKNEYEHKNFISKVGFYTVSTILGIIIIGITILQFVLGR